MNLANQPTCYVLLAAYNGERYIRSQILSILRQTGILVELYIFVDPSKDRTRSICESYSRKYSNVHTNFNDFSSGSAHANFYNIISSVSSKPIAASSYFAFSDQDDVWCRTKIISAINSLKSEECDGYSSNLTARQSNEKHHLIRKDLLPVKFDYLYESASAGCTYVLNYDLFYSFSKFLATHPEVRGVSHDWAVYAFARFSNFRWYYSSDSLIIYRQHDSNVAGANIGFSGLLRRLTGFFKWYRGQQSILYQLFHPSSDSQDCKYNLVFNMSRRKIHSLLLFVVKLFGIIR